MMAATDALAQVGTGFAQPVHGAQQVFRTLLEAMARPGRLQRLPAAALAGLAPPPGLPAGLAALLLALLDTEAPAWLDEALGGAAARQYLRFHAGLRLAPTQAEADFVVCDATGADAALWSRLNPGSDAVPQDGATLLLQVPALAATPRVDACGLRLRGPGIADTQTLWVAGPAAAFWRARIALEPAFPLGVDLVLSSGDTLAALPRSTHVTLIQEG